MQSKQKQSSTQLQFLKGIEVSEERGKEKFCSLCHKEFSFTNKEHQCKRCQRPVCQKCSPHKAVSLRFDKNPTKTHRQCNICKDELQQMQKFVQDNQLAFCKDTVSKHWLLNHKISIEDAQLDYRLSKQEAVKTTDLSEYNMFQSQKLKIFDEVEASQNYSMSDFFDMVLKGNSKATLKATIEEVLDVFLRRYPQVGYQPDLVILTLFLLCFSSVQSAYTLLTVLYSSIIPPYLYCRAMRLTAYDFKYEINSVIEINNQINRETIDTFLKSNLHKYITTATVNLFLFETTFLIWSEMFSNSQNGYQTLLKCIASGINLTNEELRNMPPDSVSIEKYLLKTARANKIQTQLLLTKNLKLEQKNTLQDKNNNEAIVTRNATLVEEKDKNFETMMKQSMKNIREAQISLEQKDKQIIDLQGKLKETEDMNQELNQQIQSLKEQLSIEKEQKIQIQEEIVLLQYNLNQSLNIEVESKKEDPVKLNKKINALTIERDNTLLKNQQLLDDSQQQIYKINSLENQITDLIRQIQQMEFKNNTLLEQINQKDLEIKKINQEQEIQNRSQDKGSGTDTMSQLLISKNQEINYLSEKLINTQKGQNAIEKQYQDILKKNEDQERLINTFQSQIETLKQKYSEYPKLQIKVQQAQLGQKKAEEDLQNILKNQEQQFALLNEKNKDIQELKNSIIQLNLQINEKNTYIDLLKADIKKVSEEIEQNVYVTSKFGKFQIIDDKKIEKEVEELIKDLDSIKSRQILVLKETLNNLNTQLRFKKLEAQVNKEETQTIKEKYEISQNEVNQYKEQIKIQLEEIQKLQLQKSQPIQSILSNVPSNRQSQYTSPLSQSASHLTYQSELKEKKKMINEINQIDDNQSCAQPNCNIF